MNKTDDKIHSSLLCSQINEFIRNNTSSRISLWLRQPIVIVVTDTILPIFYRPYFANTVIRKIEEHEEN